MHRKKRNRILLPILMATSILIGLIIYICLPSNPFTKFTVYHVVKRDKSCLKEVRNIPSDISTRKQIEKLLFEVASGPQSPHYPSNLLLPITVDRFFIVEKTGFIFFIAQPGGTIQVERLNRFIQSVYITLVQNIRSVKHWRFFYGDKPFPVTPIHESLLNAEETHPLLF